MLALKNVFNLLPKPRTYLYVCLIDGAARIFTTMYAVTGNQTHVSSVASLLRNFYPGNLTSLATAAALKKGLRAYFPKKIFPENRIFDQ